MEATEAVTVVTGATMATMMEATEVVTVADSVVHEEEADVEDREAEDVETDGKHHVAHLVAVVVQAHVSLCSFYWLAQSFVLSENIFKFGCM